MKWFFLLLLLFIAIILEATITTVPLVFIILFCFAVVFHLSAIFLWSFLCGIVLDVVTFSPVGTRSLFFLLLLCLTFLYQRKFEIQSFPFVLIFSFLGSLLYGWILRFDYFFAQAIVAALIAVGLFFIMQKGVRQNKV